jgi:hypothetical protein
MDAARLIGTADVASGLVLTQSSLDKSEGSPNRVSYRSHPGVHGNDSFAYAASDCLAWSPESAVVTVQVEPPSVDFSTAYQYARQVCVCACVCARACVRACLRPCAFTFS